MRLCLFPNFSIPLPSITSSKIVTPYYVFSHLQLFGTSWTVACQAPPSVGFPRQEYWSGLPFPPPGVLPDPGIEPKCPASPALQADSLPLRHQGSLRLSTKSASLSSDPFSYRFYCAPLHFRASQVVQW